MKSESVHLKILRFGVDLFLRQPPSVGESELELILVESRLRSADDGGYIGQSHLADLLKVVPHLLLLVSQLLAVGQHLPLTATAEAEMGAERFLSLL